MKTKIIIIEINYFDKLRLVRKTGKSKQTKKDDFYELEHMLKNDKKELEKNFEEVFLIYNVEIIDYTIVKYKWWEFWK